MRMKKIIQTINKHKRFLISTHVNPDPDALCSELALALYLKSIGKTVTVVNEEDVPSRFYFLPGSKSIKSRKAISRLDYEVAIVVDCGDLNRIGNVQELLDKDKMLINIDHHITNDHFGTINYIDSKASSTCEMLFTLLKQGKCKLTDNIALHLYAGIMTDTGSFRYENATAETHMIVGELRKYNFSAYALYQKLYESIPVKDVKAFTNVVSRFDELHKGRVVCVELEKKVLSKFSEDFDLRDMIFKYLRAIKGVELIIIFTESASKETRINLRSTATFNVAKMAHHFNGGGHRRASGCSVKDNMRNTRRIVLQYVKRAI